jgi:proteasome accessory factor A
MNEYASFLKVGAASLILRMLEEPNVFLGDLTLENPIRAIREISHDITCKRKVRLASGRELSAVDIQSEFLEKALKFADRRDLSPEEKQSLQMWEHCITNLKSDPLVLSRECDWVTKYHLIESFKAKQSLSLSDPKIALIDLQYHDVSRSRGLFYILQNNGRVERICSDEDITHAVEHPPQTTRAKLRGDFIRRAKERNRDYTVDWVHLKLNDQAQRTVLCKDPFKSIDERVEKLIESL